MHNKRPKSNVLTMQTAPKPYFYGHSIRWNFTLFLRILFWIISSQKKRSQKDDCAWDMLHGPGFKHNIHLPDYLKQETFRPVFYTQSFLKSGFFGYFFIQMLRTNRRHFACDRLILTYEITGYRTRKKVKMLQLCGCSTHTKRDTVFLLIQWLCSPFQVYSVVTLMWQSLRTTDGHYARAPY